VWLLLNSRRRVIFVMGRRDQDGNPLAPSRLWFACDAEEIPVRVRQFFGEGDEDEAGAVLALEGSGEGGFSIPAPVNVPAAPDVIAVTSFRDYLSCPYRYFLRRELRLESVADDVRELDAAAFGSLMHEVLNEFGTSKLKDSADAASIAELLKAVLERQALVRFGRSRSATVSVQLKILETRLEVFAERQAETVREGWRILYTEQRLVVPEFEDVRGRRVAIEGRVDRIDRHIETGVVRILDYKTSEQ
ncbi:MAG: PD-(D/E)XK nuclease family protein, partial [Planctomycetaceae bacterium]